MRCGSLRARNSPCRRLICRLWAGRWTARLAGDLTTSREDTLWDRISEEYGKYWTATGQTRAVVRSLERTVVEAKDDVDEFSRKLEEIERDTNRMSHLVGDARSLVLSRKASEIRESELAESWESTQRLDDQVDSLVARYEWLTEKRDRAADEQRNRLQLIDTVNSRNRDLASLQAEAEQAAPALAVATRHLDAATADLDTGLAALRSAESKRQLAIEDRDHLRRRIELVQLKERHDRFVQAEKVLKEAVAFLESTAVDDTLLGSIEQASLDYELAKAATESAAASVETTALGDITVHFDGETVELATNEAHRTLVDDELVLAIPNIARICISAGAESRGLAEQRRGTGEAYRRLCNEAKVANISEARTAVQQRREEERNRDEAMKSIEQNLRDLTAGDLLDKINGLSKRVASYPKMRPPYPNSFLRTSRKPSGSPQNRTARSIFRKPHTAPAKMLLAQPRCTAGSSGQRACPHCENRGRPSQSRRCHRRSDPS